MSNRVLPELLQGWASNVPDITVSGIRLDSREIREGEAFIAVKGLQNHGLDFAPAAVNAEIGRAHV